MVNNYQKKALKQIKDQIADQPLDQVYVIELEGIPFEEITPEMKSQLESFSALQMLTINNCGLTSLNNFPCCPSLIRLNLNQNKLGESDLKYLKKIRQFIFFQLQCELILQSIQTLYLCQNQFTSIKDFNQITHMQKLLQLNLSLSYLNNNIYLADNAVCNVQDYAKQLFDLFPSLNILDGFDRIQKQHSEKNLLKELVTRIDKNLFEPELIKKIKQDQPIAENKLQLSEDNEKIIKIQQQMFENSNYLYDEKVNLVDTDKAELKKQDFQNFLKLIEPNETLFPQKTIKESDQLIEQVSSKYDTDDIFVLKILKEALKKEEVQLVVQDSISINEERSLSGLLNDDYSKKAITEITIPDDNQQNFLKIKNSQTEKDNFIANFKRQIVTGYNATHQGETIKPENIIIVGIQKGSIKVQFAITDSKDQIRTVNEDEMQAVAKKSGLIKYELKVHPLLKYCTLSPSQFDTAGNIDFTKTKAEVQQRGGLVYNQPDQWKRYGLKVTGQYKNEKGVVDDTWLTDWGVDGWAVAYHWFSETRGNNRSKEQKDVTKAINNIQQKGFIAGDGQVYQGNPDKHYYCRNLERINQNSKDQIRTVNEDEMQAVAKKSGLIKYELKVHPLLKYCTLSPSQFDTAGNIDFTKTKAEVQQRGGLVYNQPDQWKRYGLKVTGQYKNEKGVVDDTWLTDWGVDGWAVAYHWFSETRGNNRSKEQKDVTKAINNIQQKGFIAGDGQVYQGNPDMKTGKPITKGVYFANTIEGSEKYASYVQFPDDPKFKYKIAFSCRLNPKAIQFATNNYYVVENNKDIRPYGMLLRKYPINAPQ